MAKYVFPAIFTQDGKQYSVRFPDVPGAITCGDDLKDAYQMAEDALALVLMDVEDGGERIPEPTNPNDIKKGEGEIVSLVYADTEEYRKSISTKAVKRTVSLPMWLDARAEKANLSLSRELQDALKAKLGGI